MTKIFLQIERFCLFDDIISTIKMKLVIKNRWNYKELGIR